jgi:hypothetical protein
VNSNAVIPASGALWDICKRKDLTYRSYGEHATRASDGTEMLVAPAALAL